MAQGAQGKGRRRRSPWRLFVWAVLLAGGASAVYHLWGEELVASGSSDTPGYRLVKIERGDVDATVNASGTLKATVTVEVGAQVTGQIKELLVDYNSPVREGQIVARIDPQSFQARVVEARADLKVADATVTMQEARVLSLAAETRAVEATFKATEREFERKRQLLEQRIAARSDYDKALREYEETRARLDAARAKQIEQSAQLNIAKAQVEQRRSVLHQREIELERTIIRSPVDGVVIARQVDTGQTVSAATTAPILFKIAGDLTRMQVEVGVDEADIGRIREGQKTFFTVDTFPGQRFPGTVVQVRKEPKEVQNVITYTVIVSAENPENRLLPGLTANVTFYVSQRRNVLKVSNAALRFRPPGGAPAAPGGAPDPATLRALREAQQRSWRDLVKALSLTEDQQVQLRRIAAEAGLEMRKLIQGMRNAPDPERLRAAVRQLRQRQQSAILEVLTPAQREAYRARRAETRSRDVRPAVLYRLGPTGQPVPVRVLVGATDGAFTEIVGSTLKPGDELVIGIQSRPSKGGGLRLRL